MPSPIDSLFADGQTLSAILLEKSEPSLISNLAAIQSKVLLLSSASWFESRLSEAMRQFASIHSKQHSGIQNIIRVKAIERQYHAWFDWDKKTGSKFYNLFGECGEHLKAKISSSINLQAGEKAFMELGLLRNRLVHENFVAFPLTATASDLYTNYQKAELYITWLISEITNPDFGRKAQAQPAEL